MRRLFDNKGIRQLIRFYQAAVINTIFGVSVYMVLVFAGLNIFAAQIIAHISGMTFNYFSYSRHVFHDHAPAKTRFIISYAVNYIVSLGVLASIARFVGSPYLAGIYTALAVSLLNYVALKYLVFKAPAR